MRRVVEAISHATAFGAAESAPPGRVTAVRRRLITCLDRHGQGLHSAGHELRVLLFGSGVPAFSSTRSGRASRRQLAVNNHSSLRKKILFLDQVADTASLSNDSVRLADHKTAKSRGHLDWPTLGTDT